LAIGGIIMVGYGGSITNNYGYKYCPEQYFLCLDKICINPRDAYPLDELSDPRFIPHLYSYIFCKNNKNGDYDLYIIKPTDTVPYTLIPGPTDSEKHVGYILIGVGLFLWFIFPCIPICFTECIDIQIRYIEEQLREKERLERIEQNKPKNLIKDTNRDSNDDNCAYCKETLKEGLKTKFVCGHKLHTLCFEAYKNALDIELRGDISCPTCRQKIIIN
jgi:hypothetical protein